MQSKEVSLGTAEPVLPGAGTPAGWVLALLLLMNVFLTLDKTIFLILLEPIKKEFQLHDWMLGGLSGTAFAICMGITGIPLGALADRVNRRNLAVACLTVWSAMTMLCGVARNFVDLVLARMLVGVGEAGGAPAALSILSDLFPRDRRATAMSVYALGPPLTTLISLTAGTWVAHAYGWRTALIAAGAPGLLIATAMLLFMKEPRRVVTPVAVASPGMGTTLRIMFTLPSYVHLVVGVFISYLVLACVSTFTNSFLIRVHHVDLARIGPFLGALMSIVGVATGLSMGVLTDKLGHRDERWRGWVMALGSVGSALFGWAFLLSPSLPAVIAFVALFAASATYWMGPAYSLCQSLAPARMRGKALAAMLLIGNTGGYVIGPPLVGYVSDRLHLTHGDEGLRYALLGAASLNLWAAVHFARMARRLPRDLVAFEPAGIAAAAP